MSNLKLNKEEKGIIKDFEAGKFRRIKSIKKEKVRYQQCAKRTLTKPRNINIRISERDLRRIKTLAAEKGLPYQTFISSLLHQYSTRKTREPIF